MNLVIVESPTKARTLRRFLGKEFVIEASMGHVRDLPKSSLGVDTSKGFEPEYEISKGKKQVITGLKKAATTAKTIYLATDPDREGEAISWHIKDLLQANGRKRTPKIAEDHFKRVTFHEITKKAIEEALQTPGELNMAMVDAQQARRVVDRLVGYTLSPVLWKKVRRGLSAGRVQSVAVRLIVEREREILAFEPVEYWNISARLHGSADDKQIFVAELVDIDGKKLEIKGASEGKKTRVEKMWHDTAAKVEPVVAALKAASYTVTQIDRKEQVKKANPPFTTSTLQQAAANVLGWSGKQTMAVAQQLYEAGLITYHRTDSFHLADEAVSVARTVIGQQYGAEFVPETPNFYQTKSKNAQEAHEAVRPTDATKISGSTLEVGDSRQEKLYQLIWRRFIACQMKSAIYDQTNIRIEAINPAEKSMVYGLRASGSVVKFEGWRKAYGDKKAATSKKQDEEVILPEMQEQENLHLDEVLSEQKFTQPPARYNDASLIKELEKRGIGRPSTYASILSTIADRGYVERLEKRYQPTSIGMATNDFLVEHFPVVLDYQFTAGMEDDLDSISRGEKAWKAVMKAFWGPFEKSVKAVDKSAGRVEIPVEKTGEKCPKCKEGELVIRTGKYGKFVSCGRFPECDYKASLRQVVEGVACPECGSEIVQKRTRTGRTFWGCSSYPKCKWASWQDPTKSQEKQEN